MTPSSSSRNFLYMAGASSGLAGCVKTKLGSMSSERQQDGYVPKMFLVSLKPDTGLSVISIQSVGWPNLEPLAMSPIEKVKEGLAMLWSIARDAAGNWSSHKDSRQGAALAYYSVFSIGPIIVIAIASPAFFSVVRR